MKRTIAVTALGLLCSGGAHAGLSVGAGTEYMEWREFSPGTNEELLDETGFRFYVDAGFSHPVDDGIELAYSAKLYSGQVDYDGQYQDGTAATTQTDYDGVNVEVRALFSAPGNRFGYRSQPAVAFGVGVDSWTRDITGPGGYEEEYQVSYIRLGLEQGPSRANPWSARLGLLHPIDVQEEVKLFDGVDLEPEPEGSFYIYLGYRLVPQWELEFGYQAYRFGQSDPSSGPVTENGVPVDINGDGVAQDFVLQPKSELDTYSVTLRHRF